MAAPKRLEYELRLRDLATKSLRKFGKTVKTETTKAQAAFQKLNKTIGRVGAGLKLAFAGAVFLGLRTGVQRLMSFSKAMGEVRTIMDETTMSFDEASQKVEDLALRLGAPAPEVAAGLYQTLSAGVTDSTEAFILMEQAGKLAIGGVASTAEAVDLLTTTLNSYGQTVTREGVEKTSDMIFKMVQMGKNTIPELSAAMGQVLPQAAQLGVAFEEVGAAVGTLTLAGLSVSEAVTQVSAVMTAFLKKGETAKKMFPEISNLMGANAIKTKGLVRAMQDLVTATGGSEDELVKLLGRVEGAKAVMSLTGKQAEKFADQLDGIGNASGETQRAFSLMMETTERKMAKLKEAWAQGWEAMAAGLLGFSEDMTAAQIDKKAEAMRKSMEGLGESMGGISSSFQLGLEVMSHSLDTVFIKWPQYLSATTEEAERLDDAIRHGRISQMEHADALRESMGLQAGWTEDIKDEYRQLHLVTDAQKERSAAYKEMEDRLIEHRNLMAQVAKGIDLSSDEMARAKVLHAEIVPIYNRYKKAAEAAYGTELERYQGNFKHLKQFEEMLAAAAAAAEAMGKAGADAAGEIEGALAAVANVYSDAFKAEMDDLTDASKHAFEIQDMLAEDGLARDIARLEFRAQMEEGAMIARLVAAGKSFQELDALATPWEEARRVQLDREVEELIAAYKKKEKETEKSERERLRIIKANAPLIQAALQGPIAFAFQAAVTMFAAEEEARLKSAAKSAKAAQEKRAKIIAQYGPLIEKLLAAPWNAMVILAAHAASTAAANYAAALAGVKSPEELFATAGGAISEISPLVFETPIEAYDKLKGQIQAAKNQAASLFDQKVISQEALDDIEKMIHNVEHYELANKLAATQVEKTSQATASYGGVLAETDEALLEFMRSLEELGTVQAGVVLGVKNFTDSIPEIGEAIAEVTEGAMANFASGLTNAFMAMAKGTKSAGEAFREFAANFIIQTSAMIVQMLILQAIKTAFGIPLAEGGVVEGGVGPFTEGGASPFAMGGVVAGGLGRAIPVRGYAHGGSIVSEPHIAVIGEGAQNEAVVPLPDGRSIPVDLGGSGGAQIAITINAVDARGIRELLIEEQDTIRGVVRQGMTEDRLFRQSMRGGGDVAQVLPTDESFAAPDWLTPGSGTTKCPAHFFWYLGFNPALGINGVIYNTYPMRLDGPLKCVGRSQLYRPDIAFGVGIPALMTEMEGAQYNHQRCVLCREEDSFDSADIDVTVTFGMQNATGGVLGETKMGGRSGSGPTGPPGIIYPGSPATRAGTPPHVDTKTRPHLRGKWSPGSTRPRPRPGNTVTPDILYAGWLGNAVFLRAGGGVPQVSKILAKFNMSHVYQVDHYAFMAYPVVNAGTSKVDLYLELWQVKHTTIFPTTTGNVPRLLIQQVVDGGTEGLVVSQPYFLRAKCENGASNVDFNCYIGKWKNTATGVEYTERQCFKDDEFPNNTYTVGASVTHTSATGNVEDAHSDKITAYADKTIGWSMGRDRNIDVQDALFESAPHPMAIIEGLHSVEAVNPTTSNTLYRDEFSRSYQGAPPNGVDNFIIGLFGTPGSQANGLFSFDFGGLAESPWQDIYTAGPGEIHRLMLWTDGQSDISAPNDFVTLDYDTDGTGTDSFPTGVARSFIHARPSTKFYNHHRSIKFKPGADNPGGGTPAWSSNKFEFGIWLRGFFSGWTSSGTGCYLHWETDGDGTITIAHLIIANRNSIYSKDQPQGTDTFIASRSWVDAADVALWNSGGTFDLYDGNYKTLDFRAETYAAATSPSSAAIYHVEFEGSPIELTNTLPAIGTNYMASPFQSSTTTPYPVVESAPTSIGGKTEGFWFQTDAGEYDLAGGQRWLPTRVSDWVEGALNEDPVSIDPDLQPSIAVSGEGAPTGSLNTSSGALGISGSGVWEVETVVTVENFRPIRRIPFESGHVYTSPIQSSTRRRWRVMVNSAPLDVCQALQSFYNSHDGPETPFSFVVPITDANDAQETVNAWFSSDKLDIAEIGPQVYNVAFSVTELLVT